MKINLCKMYISGQVCLIPAYNSDKEILDKLVVGEIMKGTIKKNRNPKFHAKFMAILRMVVDNSDRWYSVEELIVALKYSLGLVDWVKCMDGGISPNPRSISFESMGDVEFDTQVYTPSLPLLARVLDITVAELESNYGQYL